MPGTQPQPLLDVSSDSPTVQSKPKARIAGICTKLASTLVGWSRSLAFSTASFDEGTKGARGPFWHPTRDTTYAVRMPDRHPTRTVHVGRQSSLRLTQVRCGAPVCNR